MNIEKTFRKLINAVFTKGCILIATLFLLNSCNSDYKISRNNSIHIVVPSNPSVTEKFAAEELGRYLKRVLKNDRISIEDESNASAEKNIYIGNTDRGKKLKERISGKDNESFMISANGKNLILAGNCERAVLYAAYTLLEQYGCRWVAPGIDYIPEKEEISLVKSDYIHSPGINYRVLRYLTLAEKPDQWKIQCIDWGVKNKINLVTDPELLTSFPEEIMKRGSVRGINSTHVAGHILTRELYEKNPEVFARDKNGKSILTAHSQQFCFSAEKAVSVYTDKISEYIRSHPEVELFPVTQADGTNYCQCDNCSKLYSQMTLYGEDNSMRKSPNVTKPWMKFVSNVAEKINQSWPDKKFYTLAYSSATDPMAMDFKMNKNVVVVLVHSVSLFDQLHTYEKGTGRWNYLAFFKKWSEKTPGGVGVYDYYPFSKFRSLPLVGIDRVTADIRAVHTLGCPYFELQSVTSPGMYLPVYYAAARVMWDPGVDVEKEISLFYKGMYGNSAPQVENFFRVLEKAREAYPHAYKHDSRVTDLADVISYMTKDVVLEADEILQKAVEVAGSGEYLERLQPVVDQFNYAKHLRLGRDAFSSYNASGEIRFLEDAVHHAEAIRKLTQEVQNSSGIRKNLGMVSAVIVEKGRN